MNHWDSSGSTHPDIHMLWLQMHATVPNFYVHAGDPNLGPHAYRASTSLIEPTPQLLKYTLKVLIKTKITIDNHIHLPLKFTVYYNWNHHLRICVWNLEVNYKTKKVEGNGSVCLEVQPILETEARGYLLELCSQGTQHQNGDMLNTGSHQAVGLCPLQLANPIS